MELIDLPIDVCHYKLERRVNNRVKDITGNVYGDLSIVGYAGIIKNNSAWLCQCKCGRYRIIVSPGQFRTSKRCRVCFFKESFPRYKEVL